LNKEENNKIGKKEFGIFGKYYHYVLGSALGLFSFIIFVISKKLIK